MYSRLEDKEAGCEASKDTIHIVEDKVGNAEAEVLRHFKELQNLKKIFGKEKGEAARLKNVIKNNNEEKWQ